MPNHVKKYVVFCLLLHACAYAQVPDGLVARYSFNKGDARNDLGGPPAKAYDVDLAEDRFGNANKAYNFKGHATSYINLGTNSILKPENGTISLWFNPHNFLGLGKGVESNPVITTCNDTTMDCNQAYYIGFDLNTLKINGSTVNSCTKGVTTYSKKAVNLNKWYHVAIAYDDDSLRLYVNGVPECKIIRGFKTQFLEGDSVVVGAFNKVKNIRYFLGSIDDIEIYNRVLKPAEIRLLYNAPDPNKLQVLLKNVLYFLAGCLLLLFIFWLIKRYIRKVLQKENERNLLMNRAYEQDSKVIKAQMSPHFIFNALNSIQQFIITNENDKAQLYLSRFSRLLRRILESNAGDSIRLKDEIETLIGYLEIESLRFNNVFQYTVKMSEALKDEKINIPNFLVQPFVENAIWHGLLPKTDDRRLLISFERADAGTLICTVDDNGVGRENGSAVSAGEKRSFGIDFVRQRLELLGKMRGGSYTVEMQDKRDSSGHSLGTTVILTIPIL